MPTEESKPVEPIADKGKQVDDAESVSEEDEPTAAEGTTDTASSSKKKKKKSKRNKVKQLLSTKSDQEKHDDKVKEAIEGLSPEQMKELASLNSGLMQELAAR
ncbi:hypothetical protein E4U22_006836, partial [Claviceps purpurea]